MSYKEFTRRAKIVHVDEQILIDALNGYRSGEYLLLPAHPEIPADVTVLRVFPNQNRRCIDVVIAHESFDPVPDGDVIPEVADLFVKSQAFRRMKASFYREGECIGIAQEKIEAGDFVVVDQATGRIAKSPLQPGPIADWSSLSCDVGAALKAAKMTACCSREQADKIDAEERINAPVESMVSIETVKPGDEIDCGVNPPDRTAEAESTEQQQTDKDREAEFFFKQT